jgi:DNA-binding transcriptional ArsR family regulator
METTTVIGALAALAQESRLRIFRLLVEAGPDGVAAGRIGEALELPPATLSFHLAHLARAGLARSRQEGRFVYYSADFDNMTALVGYLTENCCAMTTCAPASCKPAPKTAAPTRASAAKGRTRAAATKPAPGPSTQKRAAARA